MNQRRLVNKVYDMDAASVILAILIAGLGSDDFRVREHCYKQLADAGSLAVTHLEFASKSKDIERSCRARNLLDAYYANTIRDLLGSMPPWIVLAGGPEFGAAGGMQDLEMHKYLAMAGGGDDPPWDNWRHATMFLVDDMLRHRHESHSRIRLVVRNLQTAERRWKEQYGGNYRPPIVSADLPK